MFYFICGTPVFTDANTVCLDVGGVAYRLTVSGNTLGKVAGKTEKIRLYTYLKVSQDDVELFGFCDEEELATFKLLITVSGVGPKAAIAVLSVLSPEKLAIAVSAEDAKTISRANGIGSKTAARIVLELKDKLCKQVAVAADSDTFVADTASADLISETINALTVLGYSRGEANTVVRGINPSGHTLEELITEALKRLMK